MIKLFILGVVIAASLGVLSGLNDIAGSTNEESQMKCMLADNTKSNMTSSAFTLNDGKCYYDTWDSYESNEKCGTLGFSCYETSEPYTKTYKVTKCFRLDNGETC